MAAASVAVGPSATGLARHAPAVAVTVARWLDRGASRLALLRLLQPSNAPDPGHRSERWAANQGAERPSPGPFGIVRRMAASAER